MTRCCSRQRRAHRPSVIPLSLEVDGILLQIEGIMPRKLLINKSSEFYFVNRCSAKLSSVTRQKEYAWITEVNIGQKFWRGSWHCKSYSLQSRPGILTGNQWWKGGTYSTAQAQRRECLRASKHLLTWEYSLIKGAWHTSETRAMPLYKQGEYSRAKRLPRPFN